MKKAITCLLCVLIAQFGYAQHSGIYPLSLLKLKDNYILDNPAAAVLAETPDIKLITSHYTGLGGKVGLNFLNINIPLQNKAKTSSHFPGVMIHSEFETAILKRTRVYFRYSYNRNLTASTKISAGIQAGLFNYFVRSSKSSAGTSLIAPDAALGIWLHSGKMNIGLSSDQIFDALIKPINALYALNRYFVLLGDYKIFTSVDYELRAAIKGFYNREHYKGVTSGLSLLLMRNFSVELNYSLNKGFVISGGVVHFPFLSVYGDLFFSYFNTSGNTTSLTINRFELNLRVYFAKNPDTGD